MSGPDRPMDALTGRAASLLVLVDEGPASQRAIDEALRLAQRLQAGLLFVHVLPQWNAPIADVPIADAVSQQAFDDCARGKGRGLLEGACAVAVAAAVPARSLLASGPEPVQAVCELAQQEGCELIVVGTGSANAVWRLLGGDPVPGLISRAPVPVLVCRP